MRITALNRGGLAVFGGLYDPHADEAVVLVRDDETMALVIEYPAAPTSPAKSENGIASTAPTATGNKVTATLSGLQDGGYVDFTATVAGATRKVRVRARSQADADRYE